MSDLGVKLAAMVGVREHNEGDAVELWIDRSGRIVIRAYNECGNNCTNVDLRDLLDWLKSGAVESEVINEKKAIAALSNFE